MDKALRDIEKREKRRDHSRTKEIEHMNSFYYRNIKSIGLVAIQCFHETLFHFVETIKVRAMARN